MKKLLAFVLSLTLLLTMAPLHGVHAVEQEDTFEFVVVEEVTGELLPGLSLDDHHITAEPGDEIRFTIRLDQPYTVRAGGVSVAYDTSILEYVGGEWHVSNTLLADVDSDNQTGAFAYMSATEVSGDLFTYTFKVREDAAYGDFDVIFTIILRDGSNQFIDMPTDDWTLTVSDHVYNAEITEPTCTEGGYTTFTCALCGESYVDDFTDPTGHDLGDWITLWEPTCIEDGLRERVCHCGYVEQESIMSLGHHYEAVVTDPSCTEGGFTAHTCVRCGDLYLDSYTDALGHEYMIIPGYAPTCTEDGLTDGAVCARCGITLIEQEIMPALGHSYAATVIAEPTETQSGYAYAVCGNCGLGVDLTLPALNHVDYTYVVTIEPTYTDRGMGLYTWNATEYGVLSFTVVLDKLIMPSDSVVTIGTVEGKSGDIVEVIFSLSDALELRALGLSNFAYDSENLTLISAEWLLEDSVLANWDETYMMAAIAFTEDTDLNGEIFKMTFQIHADAPEGEYIISCDATAKCKPDGKEITVAVATVAGGITVKNFVPGDVDGNEVVDTDDAIHLLYHTLFGESMYPVNQPCDFDGNGVVDTDDAIYLLYHTLFGSDLYPLN